MNPKIFAISPRPTALLILLLGLFHGVALTAEKPAPDVHNRAEALFAQFKLPGFTVAVGQIDRNDDKRADTKTIDSKTVDAPGVHMAYSGYFGHADLEHDVPITAQTRFRVGSLSKLLTVAAVARLHQEGRLDLDAPVRGYVPYLPKKKWPLSTRQLLSHTAGIRHYAAKDPQVLMAKFLSNPSTWTSVEESLSIFMDDPLVFEPGTAYAYSSYGYNLVSAVVEGAAGKPFLDYMQESVLTPLSLTATGPDLRGALIPHRTRFYYADPETGEVVHDDPVDNSYKWASGGFLSTAEDLVRLGASFLEPGFLTSETLNQVFTPQPKAEDRGYKVALGWRMDEDEQGRTIYHHGGAIAGGRAFILLVPDQGLVVVLLANSYARFGKQEALAIAEPFL